MKPRLLVEAEDELMQATLFYEGKQSGLGYDLHDRVQETIDRIEEDPLRFPVYEGKELRREYRRAFVKRFPYMVVYEIRPAEVVIVAVAHTKQDAGYWDGR